MKSWWQTITANTRLPAAKPVSSVCVIVRDEERGIAEWIAYQKVIGFDRIVIYDNGSSDRTPEIVQRAMKKDASISLIDWPDAADRTRPQVDAYNDALQRCETEWIAFFDADEFLVLSDAPTVRDFLGRVPSEAGAIAVNWRIFGSSGRDEPGEGLVIERFLRCGPEQHTMGNYCKSIVRRESVAEMKVHVAELKDGEYYDVTMQPTQINRDCRTARKNHRVAILNHYALKSRTEFEEKCARGRADAARTDKNAHQYRRKPEFWNSLDQNDLENTDILSRRDAVLKTMRKLKIR